MRPILFDIGPIPVHAYGLMIAAGFLTALFFMQRDAKRSGLDPEIIANGAFWSLLIGIAGTRIMHIIMFPELYSWREPIGWIAIWRGGLVFQGGPPAVLAFLWFYLRRHKLSYSMILDIAIPYIPLAHGIGRIGCFLNGCCYGKITDGPLGMAFRRIPPDLSATPVGSPPYLDHLAHHPELAESLWSLPVHPTQLYESAGLWLVCGVLIVVRAYWRPFQGVTLPVYLVLYGLLRYIIENFRGDHNPVRIASMSDQQVISLLFAIAGVMLFAIMYRYAPRGSAIAGKSRN